MSEPIHLVMVSLRPAALAAVARRKHVPLRDLDEGYLAHCLMRELWGDEAPAPFLLRPRARTLEALGYSRVPAEVLVEQARSADAGLLGCLEDRERIASRPVPCFEPGHMVGFHLRACPVVRLAGPTHGHRAGAEVDAFLAKCFSVGAGVPVARQDVYQEWLARQFRDVAVVGARLEWSRVAAIQRQRMVRRTQEEVRRPRRIERPDVVFEGALVVSDAGCFQDFLARGVGRHKAFGFGALLLVPAGTSWSR